MVLPQKVSYEVDAPRVEQLGVQIRYLESCREMGGQRGGGGVRIRAGRRLMPFSSRGGTKVQSLMGRQYDSPKEWGSTAALCSLP